MQLDPYQIYIKRGLLANRELFSSLLGNSRIVIVTDVTVANHYLDILLKSLSSYSISVIILESGEEHKGWPAVDKIIHGLHDNQHDRYSTLISLGGGIIGDLAGFTAAIFMRGINFVQIPTTLLAQVDACIGGKNGFNYLGTKNLIGTFYNPSTTIIDPDLLQTLSAREYKAGLAEIIKYGMACDAELFIWLEENTFELNQKNYDILAVVIARCCKIKLAIVENDQTDRGQRQILNFGHTFAHALEASTWFNYYLHGEAVALGMLLATWLAVKLDMADQKLLRRLKALLKRLNLPTQIDFSKCSTDSLVRHLVKDKKKEYKQLTLILPYELGKVKIVKNLELDYLQDLLGEYAST